MQPLTTEAEATALLAAPEAWILKHSNACPVSFAAHDQVAAYAGAHPGATIGVVTVQTHRPLSNWLAQRLAHVHQSPQLFLVRAGKVAWTASHWGITTEAMEQAQVR